jgi:hypothetical protein
MTPEGELASMRERSRIAHERETRRKAAEDNLICDALIAILTRLAES